MNRCVCCGEIIPEGRQVCPNCEDSTYRQVKEMAFDIMKEADFEIELSGAIAIGLYEQGYRKEICGEWIRQEKELGKVKSEAKCSICGRDVVYQVIDNKWQFENFCPHCGAKMKGAE